MCDHLPSCANHYDDTVRDRVTPQAGQSFRMRGEGGLSPYRTGSTAGTDRHDGGNNGRRVTPVSRWYTTRRIKVQRSAGSVANSNIPGSPSSVTHSATRPKSARLPLRTDYSPKNKFQGACWPLDMCGGYCTGASMVFPAC